MLLVASFCVGGYSKSTNRDVVECISRHMDQHKPDCAHHSQLISITRVKERRGHNRRKAIDPARIETELDQQQMMGGLVQIQQIVAGSAKPMERNYQLNSAF